VISKRFAIIFGVILVAIFAIGLFAPDRHPHESNREKESRKPKSYRVEDGMFGKMVSFPSTSGSEPAKLTISCDANGKIDDFMLTLNGEPATPPPLRGVFGEFSFPHEPSLQIELAYGLPKIWMPREGQEGNVRDIIERFATGERLSFRLGKPNGSGQLIDWLAPAGFDLAATCKP
jgi:hypothetical protein